MALDGVRVAQIVVDRDAGVVDENVERADGRRRLPDLGEIGDVERQRRDALVAKRHRASHRRVHTLGAASQRLVDERSADAAVRAGDQYCLVFNLHNVLLGCHYQVRPPRSRGYVAYGMSTSTVDAAGRTHGQCQKSVIPRTCPSDISSRTTCASCHASNVRWKTKIADSPSTSPMTARHGIAIRSYCVRYVASAKRPEKRSATLSRASAAISSRRPSQSCALKRST